MSKKLLSNKQLQQKIDDFLTRKNEQLFTSDRRWIEQNDFDFTHDSLLYTR